MFKLPITCPTGFKDCIEDAFSTQSTEAWESLLRALIGYFKANTAIFVVEWELSSTPSLHLLATKDSDQSVNDELVKIWFDSGLNSSVLDHMKRRVNPISYSLFSWPFEVVESDQIEGLSLPSNYTIVFPVSNKLCLHLNTKPSFDGYLMLSMNSFPEFENETIRVVTSVPSLISSMVLEVGMTLK